MLRLACRPASRVHHENYDPHQQKGGGDEGDNDCGIGDVRGAYSSVLQLVPRPREFGLGLCLLVRGHELRP